MTDQFGLKSMSLLFCHQWRIQDFPDRWGQPLNLGHRLIMWQDFCRKLHENERNWTKRGACFPRNLRVLSLYKKKFLLFCKQFMQFMHNEIIKIIISHEHCDNLFLLLQNSSRESSAV